MSKYFHISIVWADQIKLPDQLRSIFDLAQDWAVYGVGSYLIYTREELYTWQGRMMAVISQGDFFFICEISDIKSCGGFLPRYIWDWINKDRTDYGGTIFDVFPPMPPAGLFKP
jgi:hypothetical protein